MAVCPCRQCGIQLNIRWIMTSYTDTWATSIPQDVILPFVVNELGVSRERAASWSDDSNHTRSDDVQSVGPVDPRSGKAGAYANRVTKLAARKENHTHRAPSATRPPHVFFVLLKTFSAAFC